MKKGHNVMGKSLMDCTGDEVGNVMCDNFQYNRSKAAMTLDALITALTEAREHVMDDIDGDSEVRACLDSGAPETARIMDIETENGIVKIMLDDEF